MAIPVDQQAFGDAFELSTQPSAAFGSALSTSGFMLSTGAALLGAIGAFNSARAQRYELKSAAMTAEHEATMDALGARQAELQARLIRKAGLRERGFYELRAAQERAETRASTAARGLEAGVGSARDVAVSQKIAHEIDARTITSNALQQEQAAQRGALSLRNRALLGRTSARNLRRTASSLSPSLALTGGLLRGAGGVLYRS